MLEVIRRRERPVLSTSDVAEILGWSQDRVQRLAQAGRIPTEKVGGKYVFRRAEIERWIRGEKPPETVDLTALAEMLSMLLSGDLEIVVKVRRATR